MARGTCAPVEFHARTWRTDEGLPHNSVSRIVQDRAGYVWFGTVAGLARFDGREFKELKLPPPYSTGGYNIRSLTVDPTGALLILPASGGVLRIADGEIAPHPISKTIKDGQPADIFVEPDGTIWVATYQGVLVRRAPDGSTHTFGAGTGVASRLRKFTFAADDTGSTWIASDDFLAVYRDGDLHKYPQAPPGPLMIAQGTGGRIWVCTNDSLLQLERGRLHTETDDVPWRGNSIPIRHLFEDTQGALWIARSRGGLLRYAQRQMQTVKPAATADNYVTEDNEGSIWIATDGEGVARLRSKSHRIFNASSGLIENVVSTLAADASGRVWLANRWGGVAAISTDDSVEKIPLPPDLHVYANVIAVDSKNRIWFGGGRDGLQHMVPGSPDSIVRLREPEAGLRVLRCMRNGDMWFATDPDRLGFYRGDTLHVFTAEEGFPRAATRALSEDTAGNVWIGCSNGRLLRWDGRKMETVDLGPTLHDQPIHDLHASGADELWIATASGLVLRKGSTVRIFTEADGLADSLISQIAEDNLGRLWMAARRGLFLVAKTELEAVFRGEIKRVTSRLYGRDQGLEGITPTANFYPKTARTRDGRLWFSTAQGALAVDPAAVARDLPPPPVFIDEIRLDGQAIARSALARLPSGRHRLEFRFTAPSFSYPDNVEVKHRLDGADSDWVESGTDRAAAYTNLSHGAYRLHVAARHKTGEWTKADVDLKFTIVPAWWETGWFRFAVLAGFTAVTAWIVRTISQRVLKRRLERLEQEHALEKERARIARDLHDDLGSGLTELGLLAERIAGTPGADSARLLSNLAWRTRRLATELSGIVWTMNGSNGRMDRLATFIAQYAQRLFRHTGIACVVRGADTIPAFPIAPDPQHQLLTATKEALTNIIKHAQATATELTMSHAGDVFELSIHDNGTGFDIAGATDAADGNGLRNMRSRLAEIGGTLTMESAAGKGTTVVFRLPCGKPPPVISAPKTSQGSSAP